MYESRMRLLVVYVVNLGTKRHMDHWLLRSHGSTWICSLPHMMKTHGCPSCKPPLHRRLYKQFIIKLGMPLDFKYNITHGLLPVEWGNPHAYNLQAQQYVEGLQGCPMNLTTEHIIRVVHEIYLGFTPKTCCETPFLYLVMGGYVGDTR